MVKIGVLVSGGGTNLQALIDAENNGAIRHGKIVTVVSSKPGVYALERAKQAGIPAAVICKKDFADGAAYDKALCAHMQEQGVELIVLAGFLMILGDEILRVYKNKIINIHPSLIPSFCGDGFYGLKVHQAALDYGVKVTGATAHFVNEVTDGGRIILQKAVYVQNGDTSETLQKRVMEEAEWKILPEAVELFCTGKLDG